MLELRRTNANDPDFKALVSLLDKELWERYPEEQSFFDAVNKIDLMARVVVCYDAGNPVACGCIRQYNANTAELKRMFTVKEQRNRGFAREVLQFIERWAREEGCTTIILETGIRQPEAQRVYSQSGYKYIDNFGVYANNPNSVCMEKLLE